MAERIPVTGTSSGPYDNGDWLTPRLASFAAAPPVPNTRAPSSAHAIMDAAFTAAPIPLPRWLANTEVNSVSAWFSRCAMRVAPTSCSRSLDSFGNIRRSYAPNTRKPGFAGVPSAGQVLEAMREHVKLTCEACRQGDVVPSGSQKRALGGRAPTADVGRIWRDFVLT